MQLQITENTGKKRRNLSTKQWGNIHAAWIFKTNCRIRSRLRSAYVVDELGVSAEDYTAPTILLL